MIETMIVGRLKLVARNSIIKNRSFLKSWQTFLQQLLGGNSLFLVKLDFVDALVLVGTEQQVDGQDDDGDCNNREDVEADLTSDQAADLYNEGALTRDMVPLPGE